MMRLDALSADGRFAVRQLLKSPGFSLVAILTLALGIGANSTIFSVVNSMLFRPSGFAEPDRLVDVYATSTNFRYSTTSYPDYADLRDRSTSFSGILIYRFNTIGFSRTDQTKPVWTETVSGNYFSVLGLTIPVGRGFDASDDVVGAAPVAVLSHTFWEHEYSADSKVIGSAIRLNGHPFTIVGVAPKGFHGMVRGLDPAVWFPAASYDLVFPGSSYLTNRNNNSSFMRARLKPGVTVEAARQQALEIAKRLGEEYPGTNQGREFVVVPTAGVVLNPGLDGLIRIAALVLLAVPALVLLITCANLATLMLTRATGRRREIAVRLALGATRRDVARQLLSESLLLAIIGGGAGLLVAAWLSQALARFRPPLEVPLSLDTTVDGRVLGFTVVVTLLTGLMFGLVPAIRAGRVELAEDTREGARGAARRSRLQSGLVAAQISISMVLLIGCGLLLRSMAGVASLDLGFAPEGAATVLIDPQQVGYDGNRSVAFYRSLLERTRALSDVEAVSLSSRLPLNLNVSSNNIFVEGRPQVASQLPEIQQSQVGPDYFKAVGGRLLSGREFTDRDDGTQPAVVVINEAAARLLWPGESPLGKRLAGTNNGKPGTWREVVGMVRDIKVMTVGERPTPQIFYPVFQTFDAYLTVVARGKSDPNQLVMELRRVIKELEPSMPIVASGALTDTVRTALFPLRFGVALLIILGAVGLIIASIGLYGIIAQGVVQRTRELGVRLALGAQVPDVLRMVFRDGLVLAGTGTVIGLGIAVVGTRLLSTWLYGVSPYDPIAFLVAPLTLLGVALLACWLPARRAARVDPVIALRSE